MDRKITILGAGLVGSLLAILLRRRGYDVTVFERRSDMRKAAIGAGRSINLAMSTRGWKALELAGLKQDIESLAIPMKGRFLHLQDGSTAFQAYGRNAEAIYSVSRGELNKRLMTLAEQAGARILFNKRCQKVDVVSNKIYLEDVVDNSNASSQVQHPSADKLEEVQADLLFGADGAFSALRTAYSHSDRVSSAQDYIEYGYKELNIEPGTETPWRMEKNALHIWPRGKFMLIALPNTDGSFTCTLFMPFEGEQNSFSALNSEDKIKEFFELNFADVLPLMPDYLAQFQRNPVASLITTYISQWHKGRNSALIGDAAHAIVPFYGQGMNAGFEDCSVLDGLLTELGEDWGEILQRFQERRKPNGDAVAALALLNFTEMRDKVADPVFLERKKIEKEIGLLYPEEFTSVYELVSFTHTPYATAMKCIAAQDALLGEIMSHGDFKENLKQTAFKAQLDDWIAAYGRTVASFDFA